MQRVQTYAEDSFPLIKTLTLRKFALYVLGVFLLEWLTLFPDILLFPHIAHTFDIFDASRVKLHSMLDYLITKLAFWQLKTATFLIK